MYLISLYVVKVQLVFKFNFVFKCKKNFKNSIAKLAAFEILYLKIYRNICLQ